MVAYIAKCPEHGLHGQRTECFVCGGPVEQVPMVPADSTLCGLELLGNYHLEMERNRAVEALRSILTFVQGDSEHHHRIGEACGVDLCTVCLIEGTARAALGPSEGAQ